MKRCISGPPQGSLAFKRRKGPKTATRTESATRRFRFKDFNERIDEIDISSIQKMGGYRGSGPTSTESTWFELSLSSWKELNCTTPFARFCATVRPLLGTLPRLLFNKEAVVAELFAVLRAAGSEEANADTSNVYYNARLAVVPILNLTAMLAKDLSTEFTPFFAEFFALLVPILPSSTDTDVIEAAFATLLYLLKCLLPHLLADMPKTFDSVIDPVFHASSRSSAKAASISSLMQRFSAQCFGYLVRKSSNISASGLFEHAYTKSAAIPHLDVFLAEALSSAIIEEQTGKLRGCLKPLLLEYFVFVGRLTNVQEIGFWSRVLRFTVVKLLEAAGTPAALVPLWKAMSQLMHSASEVGVAHLSGLLAGTLTDAFAFKRGSVLSQHDVLAAGLSSLIPMLKDNPESGIELTAYFLRSLSLESALQHRQAILKVIEASLQDCRLCNLALLLRFLKQLRCTDYEVLLSSLVRQVVIESASEDASTVVDVLLTVRDLSPSAVLTLLKPEVVSSLKRLALEDDQRTLTLLTGDFAAFISEDLVDAVRSKFITAVKGGCLEVEQGVFGAWVAILDAAPIRGADLSVADLLCSISKGIRYPEQLSGIRTAIKSFGLAVSSTEIEALVAICSSHLRSGNGRIRLESLNLILSLETMPEIAGLVNLLRVTELVPADLANYREKIIQMKRLEHYDGLLEASKDRQDKKNRNDVAAIMAMNHLLGMLQVGLNLIWAEAQKLLARFVTVYPSVSEALMTELVELCREATWDAEPDSAASEEESKFRFMYDMATEDGFLKQLAFNRIQARIENGKSDASTDSCPVVVPSAIFNVVINLVSAHPAAFLGQLPRFRNDTWIPLIANVFAVASANATGMAQLLQKRLSAVLSGLSGISLANHPELEGIFLRFLAHGDLVLQEKAFNCLMKLPKYSEQCTGEWKERFKALLHDQLFREQLTQLTAVSGSLAKSTGWQSLYAPLLLRILFGRFTARKGANAGRSSLHLRRKMIMSFLGTWDAESLDFVVDFLLEPFSNAQLSEVSATRQIGFLNLLGNVLQSLGHRLSSPSTLRLIDQFLLVFVQTQTCLTDLTDLPTARADSSQDEEESIVEPEEEEEEEDFEMESAGLSAAEKKRIRYLGMKRLVQLFEVFTDPSILEPFIPRIFAEMLEPRLPQLSSLLTSSSSTAKSSLMDLFVCWSALPSASALNLFGPAQSTGLWPALLDTLQKSPAVPEVTARVLEVLENVIGKDDPSIMSSLIVPHLERLLTALDECLKAFSAAQGEEEGRLLGRVVVLVQKASREVVAHAHGLCSRLAETLEMMLGVRSVPESSKTAAIQSLCAFYEAGLVEAVESSILSSKSFSAASALLSSFSTRPGRESLVALFQVFSRFDVRLTGLAETLLGLHVYIPVRISEPDWDVRLATFASLRHGIETGTLLEGFGKGEEQEAVLGAVLQTMVFFLQDLDELALRTQSSSVIKSIVGLVKDDLATEASSLLSLVSKILLPAVKQGLKSRHDTTRHEFVGVLDVLVHALPEVSPFSALQRLLRRDDTEDMDESNFFRNIHHVQVSRRARAVRMLSELCNSGQFRDVTRTALEDLLLPLVLPTALPDEAVDGNNAKGSLSVPEGLQQDSLQAAGLLFAQLPWKSFLGRVRQYAQGLLAAKKSPAWLKAVLRLLPLMLTAFELRISPDEDVSDFVSVVDGKILPLMFQLLQAITSTTKEDTKSKDNLRLKTALRVPIAVAIGHLLRLVAAGSVNVPIVGKHLPRLMAILLNVLRQKDADIREIARDALVKVMATLGPAFLPFFLGEGKAVCKRGYQRHVLTFTTHAVVLEMSKQVALTKTAISLDASAALLTDIALQAAFGSEATEREASEWTGKQPEVRAAKGPEIMELTVSHCSTAIVSNVIFKKIAEIAALRLDADSGLEKVEGDAFDELLRGLFTGLQSSLNADREGRLMPTLSLLFSLFSLAVDAGTHTHVHRVHSAAFRLLAHIVNTVAASETEILGRIDPFVGICMGYIAEKTTHLQALAACLQALFALLQCRDRIPSLVSSDEAVVERLNGVLAECFKLIQKGSSDSPSTVAAFRLVAALLRDWPQLHITDGQIGALLEHMRLHLEQPHNQQLTFGLLRALLSRRVVLLPLVELMGTVRRLIVTSPSDSTRQQCRSAYVSFLLQHPLAERKLDEHLDFLLANVRYEYPQGRSSVLSAMRTLIGRLPLETVEGLAEAWFVAFAMQLAKEDCEETREELGLTAATLLARLPTGKRLLNLSTLMERWITQSPKLAVQLAAWRIMASAADQRNCVAHTVLPSETILSTVDTLLDAFN